MIQENKELLLKDLCGRLSYGVKVKTEGDDDSYALLSLHPNKNIAIIGLDMGGVYATSKMYIDNIIPYLRPLSSITEEEKNELKEYLDAEEVDCNGFGYSEGGTLEDYISSIPYSICGGVVNWLNKKMFDYNGLIPMDLAIEVTENNNPYKD